MKKLILTIITLSIINLAGCYDADTATVRINLGNIPIAHHEPKSFIDRILGLFEKDAYAQTLPSTVTRLHIAAFSGDSVTASERIEADDIYTYYGSQEATYSSVEFNVPAGENIDIVVIGEYEYSDQGEGTARMISYFGHNTDTVNLKPFAIDTPVAERCTEPVECVTPH